MARQKNDGKGRIGGRQKGTPNKTTAQIIEKANELGIDPFEVLLLFAKGDWKALGYVSEMYEASAGKAGSSYRYNIDPAVRAKCAAEAVQYLYPKRKAVELDLSAHDDGIPHKIEIEYVGVK